MALDLLFVIYVTLLCANDAGYVRRTQHSRGLETSTWTGHLSRDVTKHRAKQVGEKSFSWTRWGSVSGCSRSCGTGVQYRKRYCVKTSNAVTSVTSRHLCKGKDRKYQLCSRRDCDGSIDDFRDRQCKQHNKEAHKGKHYTWTAYHIEFTDKPEFRPCQLVCTATDGTFPVIAKLSNRVLDGTPCSKKHIPGVCIQGRCKPTGCAKRLGSVLVSDRCGVCGGDNSTCHLHQGAINTTIHTGYNTVLRIPAKAANIQLIIAEKGAATLALRSRKEYHPIKDKPGVSYPTSTKLLVGSAFHYYRPVNKGAEKVWATGPTNDTLYVIMEAKDTNSSIVINYSYTIPHQPKLPVKQKLGYSQTNDVNSRNNDVTTSSDVKNTYTDDVYRTSKKTLIKSQTESYIFIPDDKNNNSFKDKKAEKSNFESDISRHSSHKPRLPQEVQQTGSHPQQTGFHSPASQKHRTYQNQVVTSGALWNSHVTTRANDVTDDVYTWREDYTACSQTCNPTGVTLVFAKCYDSNKQTVSDALCDQKNKPKITSHHCGEENCEPRWVATRWSHCSSSCGPGSQHRNIRCWQVLSPGLDSSVHNDQCGHLDRPVSVRRCERVKCRGKPEWIVSEWTRCSSSCGPGTETRTVSCDMGPNRCDVNNKPSTGQDCHTECQVQWVVSEWTLCASDCKLQHRSVSCLSNNGSYVNDSSCDITQRPLGTQMCGEQDCQLAWVPQAWGECSIACGEGTIYRQVICGLVRAGDFAQQPDSSCKHLHQPHSAASCRGTDCPGTYVAKWYAGTWSECSVTCGDGTRTRHINCYHDKQVSKKCDPESRPYNREICSQPACDSLQAQKQACRDDPRVASCELVVQHKLCSHFYYKRACCLSCTQNNQ